MSGVLSVILLLVLLGALLGLLGWMCVRVLRKAGFPGWWTALIFVPPVSFAAIWVFAFIKWPALPAPEPTPDAKVPPHP